MNRGKLVFAQLMQHLPLTTFRRCVIRYRGEFKVKSFSCLDQFLCMAFAQLTYRESLRDIEVCLRAQSSKLYHLGIRSVVARNTLANANAVRDWRIYADFAQSLIGIARRLYAQEPFGIDLQETVYALDATTIDLCLSVFPWAVFRSTKAAIKLHTLLDLRGNIPTFIHISDGKVHEVNILDQLLPEPGAFYIMDRGFLDFERLHRFVTPAPSETGYPTLLEFPGPRLLAYPKETVVAEKLQAIVKLGIANTRMKDFYDLEVLSRTFTFEGKTLAQAIQNTFQKRGTGLPLAGLPVAFTSEFYDDVNKKRQWTAFCAKNRSYVEKAEFKAVMEDIRNFLARPVRTVQEGHSFTKTWKPGGPKPE